MKEKTFIFITSLFLLATEVFAVNRTDTLPKVDSAAVGLMYKKKAKTMLVTGIVSSSAGVIAAGVAIGLVNAELEDLDHLFDASYRGHDYGSLPEILGFGGVALIAASVPLFIISGKNKHKAKLFLKYRKPDVPHANNEMKGQVSARVVINF